MITKVTGIVLGDDVVTNVKMETAIKPIRDVADEANNTSTSNKEKLEIANDYTKNIREELDVVKTEVNNLQAGQGGGLIGFSTYTEMNAQLNHPEGTVGQVMNDKEALNGEYRKVGASGSGSWVKSSDSTVETLQRLLKTRVRMATVGGTIGSIQYDMSTNTAKLVRYLDLFLGSSSSHNQLPAQTISLAHIPPEHQTYAHYWYVEPNTTTIRVGTASESFPSLESDIIGITYRGHVIGANSNLFQIVDAEKNRLTVEDVQGGLPWSGGGAMHSIVCDFHDKEVRVEAECNLYSTSTSLAVPRQTLKFSEHNVKDTDGYVALMFRRYKNSQEVTDSELYLISWAQWLSTSPTLPSSDALVAIFTDDGSVQSNAITPPRCIGNNKSVNPHKVTGGTLSTHNTSFNVLINPNNMTLNLKTKTLSVSSTETYVGVVPSALSLGRAYMQIKPQEFDCSALVDQYLWVIWYDWHSQKLVATDAVQNVPSQYATIVAYRWDTRMWWISNGIEQPNFIGEDGLPINLLNNGTGETSTSSFTEEGNRLVFPNKLFLVEGEELPLFKRSMFAKYTEAALDSMNVFITPSVEAKTKRGQRHYRSIENELYVTPEMLGKNGEVASVRMTHVAYPDNRYNVPVTIKSAPKEDADGKDKTMLFIGDSLTEGSMASDFKNKMKDKYNCDIKVVGTYSSAYTKNIASEGRGWWQYRSFIGKCNKTGAPHTLAPSGATATGKWENPFLRLATTKDKNKNPDLCFTMTSSVSETSYAENPNLGDYYIFDFDYYLSNHKVDKPDFITIALSTNDINLQRDVYDYDKRMFYMKEGLRLMLRSIQASLPSAKVAIIPAPISAASTTGYTRWEAENTNWLYECQKICKEYEVDFVPVYLHVPRDYQNPWASNVDVPNTMMKRGHVTDWVHFDEMGRDMYCNATTAWAVNRM